jgi:sugar O-acyltransferase (sialic acid O-acetyltransferase NeuD family)
MIQNSIWPEKWKFHVGDYKNKMIIFGKGHHAGVVMDVILKKFPNEEFHQVDESSPLMGVYEKEAAFIAIGENSARERISKIGCNFFNVCHPCSLQSAEVLAAIKGTFFGAFSYVGANSKVGNFCIVNTFVVFEHDSTLGDYSHLCPGVVTGGRVKIGSRTTIGLGAIIRDGVVIGDNCLIGMGAVVVSEVPNNTVVYGNPAKFVRVNK